MSDILYTKVYDIDKFRETFFELTKKEFDYKNFVKIFSDIIKKHNKEYEEIKFYFLTGSYVYLQNKGYNKLMDHKKDFDKLYKKLDTAAYSKIYTAVSNKLDKSELKEYLAYNVLDILDEYPGVEIEFFVSVVKKIIDNIDFITTDNPYKEILKIIIEAMIHKNLDKFVNFFSKIPTENHHYIVEVCKKLNYRANISLLFENVRDIKDANINTKVLILNKIMEIEKTRKNNGNFTDLISFTIRNKILYLASEIINNKKTNKIDDGICLIKELIKNSGIDKVELARTTIINFINFHKQNNILDQNRDDMIKNFIIDKIFEIDKQELLKNMFTRSIKYNFYDFEVFKTITEIFEKDINYNFAIYTIHETIDKECIIDTKRDSGVINNTELIMNHLEGKEATEFIHGVINRIILLPDNGKIESEFAEKKCDLIEWCITNFNKEIKNHCSDIVHNILGANDKQLDINSKIRLITKIVSIHKDQDAMKEDIIKYIENHNLKDGKIIINGIESIEITSLNPFNYKKQQYEAASFMRAQEGLPAQQHDAMQPTGAQYVPPMQQESTENLHNSLQQFGGATEEFALIIDPPQTEMYHNRDSLLPPSPAVAQYGHPVQQTFQQPMGSTTEGFNDGMNPSQMGTYYNEDSFPQQYNATYPAVAQYVPPMQQEFTENLHHSHEQKQLQQFTGATEEFNIIMSPPQTEMYYNRDLLLPPPSTGAQYGPSAQQYNSTSPTEVRMKMPTQRKPAGVRVQMPTQRKFSFF